MGVFLVLYALMIVAIFVMVAIVIDLGALRTERRKARNAADAAATAGALDLTIDPREACKSAITYVFRNLDLAPPSTPCSTFPITPPCSTASAPIDWNQATPAGSGYVVNFRYPVPADDDTFMTADTPGGDITQTANPATDGVQCDRVGVMVKYTRPTVFSRIIEINSNTTTVHSVARYVASVGTGGEKPALVALEPLNNCSVDAGNGQIRAFNTTNQPGLIYADSAGTGTNCSGGGNYVFNGGNPGRIWADPSPAGIRGELGYAAPTFADAFDPDPDYGSSAKGAPQPPANRIKLAAPITRAPVDRVYHCGGVTPVPATCVTSGVGINDYILDLHNRYANTATAPSDFTTFPNAAIGETCANPPVTFTSGVNWYIDCSVFSVGQPVTFPAGNIIFSGDVEIISGGILTINSVNATAVAPAGDDAIVVVRGTNGITTTSNNWAVNWYRTLVLMDNTTCPTNRATCGRLDISNGTGAWTAPAEGGIKDLIYWSETTQSHEFQGNPLFTWEGVFFAGRSLFHLQGDVEVDARNVQLWVNSASVQNKIAKLLLRPDPNKSISTSKTGSALVR
ncbi:MAG: pilus assembly protein TadG-related protein [Acidimicrobiales bacterium]